MKRILIILMAVAVITACKEDQKPDNTDQNPEIQEFNELQEQTMTVHDEVMPKMSTLMDLREKLGQISDSAKKKEASQLRNALEQSHDDMMDWMADYSDKFPHGEEIPQEEIAEKMPVLKKELEEIEQLADQTDTAIKRAEELLQQ